MFFDGYILLVIKLKQYRICVDSVGDILGDLANEDVNFINYSKYLWKKEKNHLFIGKSD